MIGRDLHDFHGAFIGDTPAVNMVGGFKEGLGMAMRKCRHCMATNNEVQTKVSRLCCIVSYACALIVSGKGLSFKDEGRIILCETV